MYDMMSTMRVPKSFTIEQNINAYVDETKGDASASDRLNELLRRAIVQEQYQRLEQEAAAFFAEANAERSETKAFQRASIRALGRD
jgi:hypothetical protein